MRSHFLSVIPQARSCRLKMIGRLLFDWLTKLSFDWPSPRSVPATLSDDLQESLPNFALIYLLLFPLSKASSASSRLLPRVSPLPDSARTVDSLSMIMKRCSICTADGAQKEKINHTASKVSAASLQSNLNQLQSDCLERRGSCHPPTNRHAATLSPHFQSWLN